MKTMAPMTARRDPDARGYFGEFGGRYVPETLVEPVEELERAYFAARDDPAFLADVNRQQLEIEDPSNGEELMAIVEKMAKTPPAVVQTLMAMFNNYKDGR